MKPIPIITESAWRGTSDCRNCGIREMVLFSDMTAHDFDLIHTPIDDFVYSAGAPVYHEGDHAVGIFTIRQGIIKLVRISPDGRERIVRLLSTGDVLGIEALATQHYDSTAIALTELKVCRIPLAVVHNLSSQSPRLHKRLLQKWQQTLKDADNWVAELNFGTSEARVARLILKLRSITEPAKIQLFSREDMGAMLDLTLETVSRQISRFTQLKVIEPLDKSGKFYRILQEDVLLSY